MKLTAKFLKLETHNFDLECVYTLELSRKGIKELGDINECGNLEILDLGFNEISDLTVFAPSKLPKLQFLNLSFNQIKHLNGLDALEGLRSLNLAGNHLDSIDEFVKLKGLENLKILTLNDKKISASNPLCQKYRDYRGEISKILPRLEQIDGESLKSNSKSLFKTIDENLLRQSFHETDKSDLDLDANEPWIKVDKSIQPIVSTEIETTKKQFDRTYEEVTRSLAESNNYINKIEKEFRSD